MMGLFRRILNIIRRPPSTRKPLVDGGRGPAPHCPPPMPHGGPTGAPTGNVGPLRMPLCDRRAVASGAWFPWHGVASGETTKEMMTRLRGRL